MRQYTRRRRFTRYETNFPLSVTVLRDDGYLRVRGRCCELAEGGLGVIIPIPLVALIMGEMVMLDLCLPGLDCQLTVRGIVRNRAGERYGLEFVSAIPGHRESILTFCRSLEKRD